jgi:hypothetical protein
MVVNYDVSTLAKLGRRCYGGFTAASVYFHRRDDSLMVQVSHEEDFLTFRLRDFAAHREERIATDPVTGTTTHKSRV